MSTEYSFTKSEGKYQVTKYVKYEEEFEFDLDKNGHLVVPKCPDCNFGVLQNRCPWERGGDCGRHDLSEIFTKIIRRDPTTHEFIEKMDYNWSTGTRVETPTGLCRKCNQDKESHG